MAYSYRGILTPADSSVFFMEESCFDESALKEKWNPYISKIA